MSIKEFLGQFVEELQITNEDQISEVMNLEQKLSENLYFNTE